MTNNECEEEFNRELRTIRNILVFLQILFFLLWCFPNSSDIYQDPWSSGEVFVPTFIIVSVYGVKYLCCFFVTTRDYQPPPTLTIHNKELIKSLNQTANSIDYTNNYNNDNNDNNDNSSYDYSYDESVTV